MINLGIVGLSDGNGHPYSFSAIINGYNKKKFVNAGWPTILEYLENEPKSKEGLNNCRVTHAWTQDSRTTKTLCEATEIDTPCDNLAQMFGQVDAVIIARDDWESHIRLSEPFLERGIPVFIDKPLTLSKKELNYFLPFIKAGKLMSCTGFRYSREIKEGKSDLSNLGSLKLVAGVAVNDIGKYGIHVLEPVVANLGFIPDAALVTRNYSSHESYSFEFRNGPVFHLDCLGKVNKIFSLSFFGENGRKHFELSNNFQAFRAMIETFLVMIENEIPPFNPSETIVSLGLIEVAKRLKEGESKLVNFHEFGYIAESLSV